MGSLRNGYVPLKRKNLMERTVMDIVRETD
jgi:hypothetical protein